MNVEAYWKAVLDQDAEAMVGYFHPEAWVNWHCTNEHFTVPEFIHANCEYPGDWAGEIERMVQTGDEIITATHVYTKDRTLSFHVTSFMKVKEGKILSVDEYWGDDGSAPQWRQELNIGMKIK